MIGIDKDGNVEVAALGYWILCDKGGLELMPPLSGENASSGVPAESESASVSSESDDTNYNKDDNESNDDLETLDGGHYEILEIDNKRKPSIGFTVKFGDGTVIKHSSARTTMIESLRYMRLERASQFRGEMFKGFPLVGKKKRISNPQRE